MIREINLSSEKKGLFLSYLSCSMHTNVLVSTEVFPVVKRYLANGEQIFFGTLNGYCPFFCLFICNNN